MRIAHIIPGSGGTFYCQNCLRDASLIRALKTLGHEPVRVPMYLPFPVDNEPGEEGDPVFFGGINVYLQQKMALFRKTPRWVDRILDSPGLLNMAAKRASTTRADGLEEMTLSMLRGVDGNQQKEVSRLMSWFKTQPIPDVVHLSNALLLGLAEPIKETFGSKVVCSLQDEHLWINAMNPPYPDQVWQMIKEKSTFVDGFISVSQYYADLVQKKIGLDNEKMHMVHIGIPLDGYEPAYEREGMTIGYMSKLASNMGLDILAQAFILLKQKNQFPGLRLKITGGNTQDDQPFIKKVTKMLRDNNVLADVDFMTSFERSDRIDFIRSLSLMSVPIPAGEAFGMFMIESMACGIPVVQPRLGAFPEIVEKTSGGILYEPNTSEQLAEAISSLLSAPEYRHALGEAGRKVVFDHFAIEKMAERMIDVYQKILD